MKSESLLFTSEVLKKEQELVEQELVELETIMRADTINYPNLIHTLKKLSLFWDEHQYRSESYFSQLAKKGYQIPMKKFLFKQGRLKQHKDGLIKALQTGSEFKTKQALENYGLSLISEIRKHMEDEDWILYSLPASL